MSRMEKFWMWLAWHLPRGLVYFAAIHVGANATHRRYSSEVVPALNFMDALARWDRDTKEGR